MKKLSLIAFLGLTGCIAVVAQTPFQRVYTTLNTKCQNATCHSATSTGDGMKFDGSQNQVYASIFNVPSALFTASVAKFEQLVKPQHPYTSFLLRKIAGATFDTDLSLDATGEGNRMLDNSGQPLTNTEIEFVRQWIRFGALKTYASGDPQPDYATINQYYTDTAIIPFLPKPPAPPTGTGIRLRMGPIFLPVTGANEQEWLQQQEVNFPYLPEVYKITGAMNTQSHHFLLFTYLDSISARDPAGENGQKASDLNDLGQVTPGTANFVTSFDGNKNLTSAWQADGDLDLPQGTAFMWDQKTYLDMNFHVKNYNAATVLPCDFYFNIYFRPKNAATIPMISTLANNIFLGENLGCHNNLLGNSLPDSVAFTQNFDDPDNNNVHITRYLWMVTGHTHKYGTAFYMIQKDSTGALTDTLYDGSYDYVNNAPTGIWDHSHPGVEYWPNLLPMEFGNNGSGWTANTTWKAMENCVGFGFTTNNEMQLFYYMYTTQLPSGLGIKDVSASSFNFSVVPNPMNNSGKLVYTLDKSAKVEASIVDVTGKAIAQLNSENEQQGTHEIAISNGSKLASGIYFARLSVDGVVYNKKFIVTE